MSVMGRWVGAVAGALGLLLVQPAAAHASTGALFDPENMVWCLIVIGLLVVIVSAAAVCAFCWQALRSSGG